MMTAPVIETRDYDNPIQRCSVRAVSARFQPYDN
jgi:hypothetical protein